MNRLVWGAVASAWLGAVALGMAMLEDYSFQPGESGIPGEHWPVDSRVSPPGQSGLTLVVALHAECGCSRATVEELNKLLAERPNALRVRALFVNGQDDAEASNLWQSLRRMPGVDRIVDPEGVEARAFALRTSGEVRVYDGRRTLRFRGGITISRGHQGASPGSAAILAAIDSPPAAAAVTTPVFGCALFGDATEVLRR